MADLVCYHCFPPWRGPRLALSIAHILALADTRTHMISRPLIIFRHILNILISCPCFSSYIFPRPLGETTNTLVQSACLGVHTGSREEGGRQEGSPCSSSWPLHLKYNSSIWCNCCKHKHRMCARKRAQAQPYT